jgi:hypothetical protein
MKFYDRGEELNLLKETRGNTALGAKMTIVVGRRRIGKTSLILKSVEETPYVYLFVSRKEEVLLCGDFVAEIQRALSIDIYGSFNNFNLLFDYLMDLSKERVFTLIIDEFQEFNTINPSVFSDIQQTWDRKKNSSKINLILSGSVLSIMKKIFENAKEPLFGRANERIHLKPFTINTLQKIISDHNKDYKTIDLFAFFLFTGGVAKYVELLVDKNALTMQKMINEIFRANSFWLDEGKNLLIEEFGKEYTTYFSILSLLSGGKTSRSEMESILGKNIGGYLERLQDNYELIKPLKPIFAKPGSRTQKYFIEDNFLNFWFRFVFKYKSALEIGNYNYVKEIFERDFRTFGGRFLEKWFYEKMRLSGKFNLIGNYWNKGDYEIDIVAINERQKKATLVEVKMSSSKFDKEKLVEKSKDLLPYIKGYTIEYKLLSLDDLEIQLD